MGKVVVIAVPIDQVETGKFPGLSCFDGIESAKMMSTPKPQLSRRRADVKARKRATFLVKSRKRARGLATKQAHERGFKWLNVKARPFIRSFVTHLEAVFGTHFIGVYCELLAQWHASFIPGLPNLDLLVSFCPDIEYRGLSFVVRYTMLDGDVSQLNVFENMVFLNTIPTHVVRHGLPFIARGLYKLGQEKHLALLEEQYGQILSHHYRLACREELPFVLPPLRMSNSNIRRPWII